MNECMYERVLGWTNGWIQGGHSSLQKLSHSGSLSSWAHGSDRWTDLSLCTARMSSHPTGTTRVKAESFYLLLPRSGNLTSQCSPSGPVPKPRPLKCQSPQESSVYVSHTAGHRVPSPVGGDGGDGEPWAGGPMENETQEGRTDVQGVISCTASRFDPLPSMLPEPGKPFSVPKERGHKKRQEGPLQSQWEHERRDRGGIGGDPLGKPAPWPDQPLGSHRW